MRATTSQLRSSDSPKVIGQPIEFLAGGAMRGERLHPQLEEQISCRGKLRSVASRVCRSLPILGLLAGCGESDVAVIDRRDVATSEPELRKLGAFPEHGRAASDYHAEVRRTSFGVPHIKADSEKGLGYGMGYAFARDNLCLLEDAILTVNGERSKYLGATDSYEPGDGSSQNNLSSDFYFKYLNAPALVHATFERQPKEIKDLLRGYAAGVNRYLREVGSEGVPAQCRRRPWVRRISEFDLVRLMRRYSVEASGVSFMDAFYAAQAPAEAMPSAARTAAAAAGHILGNVAQTIKSWQRRDSRLGSNGVALGRSATESGAGLLLANPHFPWFGGLRFYQAHLTIPGKVNVMGATLSGFPGIIIGLNQQIAWTHTVSTARHFSLYTLERDPTDSNKYFVDGRAKFMTRKELAVEVRATDGSLETVRRAYYLTDYGPLVQWDENTTLALSDANFDNDRMFQQWWAMNKASTLAAFKHSIETIVGIPWVNTLAADHHGSVYYTGITPVPNVADEMVDTCVPEQFRPLIASGVYVMAGDRSACKWRNDPGTPQRGLIAATKLPSLLRSDFVQNSNDSAWLTNPTQPLTGFPGIVGADSYEQGARTRFGLTQIQARLAGADGRSGNKFSMDSLKIMALSNRSMYASILLEDLNVACLGVDAIALPDGSQLNIRKGCDVLADWDGTANLESIGWPLFDAWRQSLVEGGVDFWKVPFDASDPINTPRGLRLSEPSVLFAVRLSLGYAMLALDQIGVDYTKPWGQIQVATHGDERIPIHGGGGNEIYNAIFSTPVGHGLLEVGYGSSALWVVSFEATTPKVQGFMTYSQSTNPMSPFYADQTRRFSEKAWIDFPFSEEAIRADSNYSTLIIAE